MLNQKQNNTKQYLKMQCNPKVSQISKLNTQNQLVKKQNWTKCGREIKIYNSIDY